MKNDLISLKFKVLYINDRLEKLMNRMYKIERRLIFVELILGILSVTALFLCGLGISKFL